MNGSGSPTFGPSRGLDLTTPAHNSIADIPHTTLEVRIHAGQVWRLHADPARPDEYLKCARWRRVGGASVFTMVWVPPGAAGDLRSISLISASGVHLDINEGVVVRRFHRAIGVLEEGDS